MEDGKNGSRLFWETVGENKAEEFFSLDNGQEGKVCYYLPCGPLLFLVLDLTGSRGAEERSREGLKAPRLMM